MSDESTIRELQAQVAWLDQQLASLRAEWEAVSGYARPVHRMPGRWDGAGLTGEFERKTDDE